MIWYAIRTAPQREFAVEAALRVKGYDVFLPVEGIPRRTKRGKGPRVLVWRPFFPRYLFIKSPVAFMHVSAERHVSGFVGVNGSPLPIAGGELERVRGLSGQVRPDIIAVNKQRKVREGDLATIRTGPFKGQIVKVEGLHGRKAKIFMNLFGSRKEVEIAAGLLEVA